MAKKRRNNLEITADILRVAKRGAKKTHIVYKANLNFNILHEYLDELADAGLIENDEAGNGTIKTTEKGVQYLNYYHGLKQFMNPMIP